MMNSVLKSLSDPGARSRRELLAEQLRKVAEKKPTIPLSFAQQRLWFLDKLEPDSPLYNVPMMARMVGTLDLSALQRAVDGLIARHEILRTRIDCADERPVQIVEDSATAPIAMHDVTSLASTERETEARKLVHAEVNRPFDLATAPLLRATLIRLSTEEHWFILNLHHIVSDEWSLRICFRELTAFYESFHRGEILELPALPLQYADYTLWQRDWLQGEVLESQLAYWRERLGGNPPLLEFTADQPRPASPTFRGSTASRALPITISGALKDLAARHGASLFMVLLAAFKTLLHRHSGLDDVLVGSPIAGRNRIETEELIGFFVNTLMLRTDLSGNPPFEELLHRVRETVLGADAHQDLPFEKLVEHLRPERTFSAMPFTRVMFAVQNNVLEEIRWPGLALHFEEIGSDTAKFDLTFVVQETEQGLIIHAEFNSIIFNESSVARLLEQFEMLLEGIIARPQRRLAELPLLSQLQRRQLLVNWNTTNTPYPRDKTIPLLFEAQALRTPDAVAVRFENESLTWRELNRRANQVAHHVQSFGVGPEVPVGLCMERSVDLVVAMLAVLKAGGAYVPLDPDDPKSHLAARLEDARPPVLLTQQKMLDRLPRTAARIICLDSDSDLIAREGRTNLPNSARPDGLACLIYTSGSTGKPKGVAIPHRAIIRVVLDTNYIQIGPSDRMAQLSNVAFDAASFEIWGALLNGAQLVGIPKEIALSPKDLARELHDRKITILFLTTALFHQVAAEQPAAFSVLRVLLFGGEIADPKWVRVALQYPPRHLLHVYGPTENGTFSTWYEVRELPADAHSVPIGKPVSNTQCYILDAHLNPVPIGIPGELYLAGEGIALGYWNQTELSAHKFIPNPFRDGRGAALLYQTGDLARWLPDGDIEFLGRRDGQVKIRGFRVELGEIETSLTRHPGVRECAVTVFSNGNGDKRLAAYIVPSGFQSPSAPELRQFLVEQMPEYMLPSAFVELSALPLTPNGKVDRKALPEPEKGRPDLGKRYASPQDAVEVELTHIWENVLGIHPIGIEDKFFELGGHSLLAVRLIAQIEKAFGRKLRLATIFQAQTIEQLAAILRKEIHEDSAISGTSLVEIQPKGSRPPFFFVHGAGGGMFWGYVNLSRYLGHDQPVYGIRSRALEFQTIEKMAAQYVADIRTVQPHGPYYVGGYCFGGNVAFEMARQLEEQGEAVNMLALFNCAPANSRYGQISWSPKWIVRFLINLCYWGKYFLNWTPPQRREFFRWKTEMLKRRTLRFFRRSPRSKATVDAGELVDLSSYSAEQRKLWENHIRALINFYPRPFRGRVNLFRSPGHPLLCSFDADYGWGDYAGGGVDITIVPGVHEKILEEPCAQVLARDLKELLNGESSPTPMPALTTNSNVAHHHSRNGHTNGTKFEHNGTGTHAVAGSYAHKFEEQARRTPDNVALRFGDAELTYAELNDRANRLAHRLQELGVGPEVLVAVCMKRSLALPTALLAVLKAGGAYVPLDRAYPIERLSFKLTDSQARVLVTDCDSLPRMNASGLAVLPVDDPPEAARIQACDHSNPVCQAKADNLAYVIYTSGSTGKPKGVEITHGSLLNHNAAIARAYRLSSTDRVLQFSPFSFDVSVEELLASWLQGCTVVMRAEDTISSPMRFVKFVHTENLSVLNVPTAYWHELTESLPPTGLPACVRLVIIGGEKASDHTWQRWKECVSDRVTLINAYGPTEATITATLHCATPADDTLPIGRPIAHAYTVILDSNLRPVARGETGELFIGGVGVARGYRNRPDLTSQRFIQNPISDIPSKKLYRTGDLARLRSDGAIEFEGRVDDQVKVRGFRIELGEIESVLRSHPAIHDAAAVVREDRPGKKRLVAYITSKTNSTVTVAELLKFLRAKLPSHMVPAAFVCLDALPMTPAGKVDRQALPPPGSVRPEVGQAFVPPRSPVEEVIAGIWCEVLGLNSVGVQDNFFDLGGHSLLATQVISRIREALQVEIPLSSLFALPTIAAMAEQLSEGSQQNQPVLPPSTVQGEQLPITSAQQRIWFLDQFEPEQSAYNIPTALRIKGPLKISALEQALTEVSRRHDALRAIFPAEDGLPTQVVCSPKNIRVPIIDLADVPETERQDRIASVVAREGRRSYVMSSPMLHPVLLRLTNEEHLLLLVTHQIASDAASVRILVDELVNFYSSVASQIPLQLPPLQVRYSESIEMRRLPPDEERAQLEYWKRKLEGAPALLDLPADRPRPAHQSDDGAREFISLPNEVSQSIERLCDQEGCKPFTILLAAFQTLLSRYTGSTDIVVGTTTENRNHPALSSLIGKFDNLIALRGDLSGEPTFREMLRRTEELVHEANSNGRASFERVINQLQPGRNASYSAIVQVLFEYDNQPLEPRDAAGVRFVPEWIDNKTAKLDLKLFLAKTAGGFSGWIEYSAPLFDRERIQRMTDHFQTLLAAALRNPEQPIASLPLMPAKESHRVLVEWNATDKPYRETATLAELFQEQVERSPDATALVAGAERLTYAELNARANQLAHHLRRLGVQPGVLVGICLERSWRLIVGILGILKAGGAYVPLDPAYPKDRLRFILEDAHAPVLVTQKNVNLLPPSKDTAVLNLDLDWDKVSAESRSNPESIATISDLAYVIYTSGSTGQPKGVALEHRGAVALLCWAADVFTPEEIAGVLASTSVCFDLSVFEMFVPLSRGGTVILAENALTLPQLAAANEVTLINSVPSAIRELLRVKGVPPSVRVVNLAGEPLTTSLVNQIYADSNVAKVYDLYGPSETTTYSTFTLRRANEPATIGRPLANEQIYLLDSHQQPVPVGIPGELYIGGVGLAREYLHRPELTAEKFVPNPFAPGKRLYRTGDLARWRADGVLEFLGRIDHQVKIRGFRIELGEVESAFRKHTSLREVVVLACEDQAGNRRLVAYVVPQPGQQVTVDELRRHGKERLPEYMVPSTFVFLDALPLTPNGKINRKALPEPEGNQRDTSTSYVAPRTPVEEQLAAIWCEVLRLERVGVHDNFFESGGNSLLAIQVISRVRECLKIELPLFSLFDAPTIERIADGLGSGEWTEDQIPVLPLRKAPRDGNLPVSFVQERLWFLDQLEPGNHAYNVPIALQLRGRLNFAALERAFNEIISRHEALRTTFVYKDDELRQRIEASSPAQIQRVDFEGHLPEQREERMRKWLEAEAQRPFDLARGPLMRIHLGKIDDSTHALLVVMHHTVSDGWSLSILFEELGALYRAFNAGKPAPALPDLAIQYADFACWKRDWMQGPVLDRELEFWKKKLWHAPAELKLPVDRAEPEQPTHHADRKQFLFPPDLVQKIVTFSHHENSTPFVLLQTALTVVFQKWTHQNDIVTGTVVAGRTRRDMESVIGCFMNFLPIRVTIGGTETCKELLSKVKAAVLEAQSHQECPFEKIVETVNPARRLNRNPLYNVALLLQNFPTEMFVTETLQASTLPVDLHSALLDLRFEAEFSGSHGFLSCEYKTELFDASTIDHLLASCRSILESLLDEPETKVASLSLTPELAAQAQASRRDDKNQSIAIAATFTAEPLAESLQHWARELDLGAKIEFAPFNQVFQQLLDPTGVLASNAGGLNVLLIRFEDWFQPDEGAGKMDDAVCKRVADEFLAALKTASRNSSSPFLVCLCPPSAPAQADVARATLLHEMEKLVTGTLSAEPGLFVVSTRELQELYPVTNYYDASGDELGRVPYTPVFFTALATIIARKFHALQRTPHKVIVLDCDQTLWSGVCGEDGASGIQLDPPRCALQEFMRAQRDSGKLLAICSKNNEEDVREVFESRNDMPLRREHIAAWRTNWIPKSENIKSIAKELNLGLDSFIFLDDNPVECAEVEANCPEVLVLQLPEDPARIPMFLKHCWVFDQLRITTEDRRRVESYTQNRDRDALRSESMNLADFIAGLNLQIQIAPMSTDQLSRMSQLTQRTNQFNCTTIRRTEAEIQTAATDAAVLAVNVRDRFGDYGIVGEMIFSRHEQSLDVDTFLLSCRVLGRGVEHAMLAHLGKIALDQKRHWVDVHFHPSPRNKPAFDFLQGVGEPFRQSLNGGYVYRFPAQFAAEVAFNPPSTEPAQSAVTERGAATPESGVKPRSAELFRRCRTIALECDDAERIHQAIEKKATVRSAGHRDYTSPTSELERQLCRTWESLLRLERVGVDDNFFELGGHSLLAVRLFAELEKLSGRKLPLVTIFQAPTVSALAKVLEHSERTRSRSPIVPIQPRGDRPPLFLIHGAGGDVLWGYANLAKHAHPDQPIYGIKSRGQIGLDEFDSIEEMARYYLEEVRAFQPNGPYLFGGYCLGGNIAYEMARQLEASGERVGPVVLIDAFPSNAGYERATWWRPTWLFRFSRNLWYWLADFRQQTAREQWRFISRKARTCARKFTRRFIRGKAAAGDVDLEEVIDLDYFPEHELKFWEIHLRALVNHVDRAFPGHVTLVRTRGQPLWCSFESDFCWSSLATEVAVKRIPGSHENIFMEPNVRFLAKEVENCLAAARGSASQPVGGKINA